MQIRPKDLNMFYSSFAVTISKMHKHNAHAFAAKEKPA